MAEKSWDDRFADLLERIMACEIAGMSSDHLKHEMRKLLEEKPAEKKDDTES